MHPNPNWEVGNCGECERAGFGVRQEELELLAAEVLRHSCLLVGLLLLLNPVVHLLVSSLVVFGLRIYLLVLYLNLLFLLLLVYS